MAFAARPIRAICSATSNCRRCLPSLRKARRHFDEALSENAAFAPALSGIARTLYMEWLLTARGDTRLIAQSDAIARRAIAADPLQSSGYREFGMTQIYLGDIDASVEALAHAESLSPPPADGLYSYGDTLCTPRARPRRW